MWQSYKEKIRLLSERIVEVQKPIRVLDAIKWNKNVEEAFFASKGKELPQVTPETYEKTSLGFDPKKKAAELAALRAELVKELGESDDLGRLMISMVDQYHDVTEMLANRGTKHFYELSRTLYGSPKDGFFGGRVSIIDLGRQLYQILTSFESKSLGPQYPKEIDGAEVVRDLQERFSRSFLKDRIEVKISDGVVADAAAGGDTIKINGSSKFSRKDIDIYEVHEGWVHVATTLNGKAQNVAKFLSKGPPRCAATQEGLAILMEILTFSSYPQRARTINDRILGIDKAEDGADFLDLYQFYLSEGYTEKDAFRNAKRVFRGGDIRGGAPFTKDISYCRGFVENYNFIRAAIRKGRPEVIPFLFAGKLHVDDVPLLFEKSREGLVVAPTLLPPHFNDLNGLAIWMSFSNFLNAVDMATVSKYYDGLL